MTIMIYYTIKLYKYKLFYIDVIAPFHEINYFNCHKLLNNIFGQFYLINDDTDLLNDNSA